jgi:hypothetical protein
VSAQRLWQQQFSPTHDARCLSDSDPYLLRRLRALDMALKYLRQAAAAAASASASAAE